MGESVTETSGAAGHPRILSIRAIVAIYWAVAATWIIVSDLVLDSLLGGRSDEVGWNIAKGIVFVTVTAALLYGLLARRQVLLQRERARSEHLERRLADTARMDTVGRFAGGVAHDFNNLLAVVRGHVDLARLDAVPAQRETFAAMDEALERAVSMTSDLQAVARRRHLELVPTDLAALVERHRADLVGMLPDPVVVEVDPGSAPTVAALDPVRFPEVLLNLAANARDAMPDGGTLRVAVERRGGRGVVTMTDTGRGMSPEEARHCFEPFFTTKPEGKGTGLGLALTYGLVRQCGGEIDVRSAPGRGSTFVISLPLASSGSPTPAT